VTQPKSRRRGVALEDAIIDAVWAVLRDVGYGGLTIEAVAAKAATSKPVIYRRWSSRAELVLAAWSREVPMSAETIDTGGLRSDLLALFIRIARRADSIVSEMITGVLADAFRDPEVVALLQERLKNAPLPAAVEAIVGRAVARGELHPVSLPERVARLPLDLIRSESMMCGAPIPNETIAELIDEVYLPVLRGHQQD
jgi:AcrR family transcriptional regulator